MFLTIDLTRHSDLAIQFREAAFVASFGNADRFHESDGKGAQRYLTWLAEQIRRDPQSCVHVWLDGAIVGQIETSCRPGDPSVGYVNLYFLLPRCRGQGLAAALDDYAVSHFRSLGRTVAQLSVSPTNLLAIRFYRRMGWQDRGPRPGHPEVHLMEKKL